MKYMHMISRERGHSKGQGVGVKGRLILSRKFICFGTITRPKMSLIFCSHDIVKERLTFWEMSHSLCQMMEIKGEFLSIRWDPISNIAF